MKLIVIALLLAVSSAGMAQMYKWRDASGRIQYSDTPPPAGAKEVQEMRKPQAPPPSAAPAAKSVADQDAAFRKRTAEREESRVKQAKAEEDEAIRLRNCEQARGQAAALQTGGRMARFNDKGERIAIDDNERERSIAEAQRAIEEWCNPKPGAPR